MKYFRLGEEPIIGNKYHAFRNFKALDRFLDSVGEENLVPVYELTGEVVKDDGGPDGLVVLIESFKKIDN
ncbi:hypothetical protein HN865_05050 [Candidatus Woesearchaeota archaeon]|nr:hypothetical protein [Candidatus Woesearchaeota archaeon]